MSYMKMTAISGLIALVAGMAGAQTLTIGVRGGPESLDPHYSALGTHAEAAKHIFDTLVWADENLQIAPGLATEWKPVDDDTWEFKLREGVKFHDGSDFTAEDVKFSIARPPIVTGPTTTAIYVRRVKEVEIIDPHTIHIHTDGPAPSLPYDFVRLFVVSHTAAADFGAHGDDLQRRKQEGEGERHDKERRQNRCRHCRSISAEHAGGLVQRVPPVDGEFDNRDIDRPDQCQDGDEFCRAQLIVKGAP